MSVESQDVFLFYYIEAFQVTDFSAAVGPRRAVYVDVHTPLNGAKGSWDDYVRSGRCHCACLAPYIQFAAAPGHGTQTEANRAGELLLGHEPVDRGSAQARHLHNGWHAQKHNRHLLMKIWWLVGWLLHGILPVEACGYFRVRRAL